MGGGGTIIIRHKIVEILSDPLISGRVPDYCKPGMLGLLAKEPGDWSEGEARFLWFCVKEAM